MGYWTWEGVNDKEVWEIWWASLLDVGGSNDKEVWGIWCVTGRGRE